MTVQSLIAAFGTKFDVMRATYTAGATGHQRPTYAPALSGIFGFVQERSSGEPVIYGGKRIEVTHVVYVDARLDIRGDDRLEFDGRILNVVGISRPGNQRIGKLAHLRLNCQEVQART